MPMPSCSRFVHFSSLPRDLEKSFFWSLDHRVGAATSDGPRGPISTQLTSLGKPPLIFSGNRMNSPRQLPARRRLHPAGWRSRELWHRVRWSKGPGQLRWGWKFWSSEIGGFEIFLSGFILNMAWWSSWQLIFDPWPVQWAFPAPTCRARTAPRMCRRLVRLAASSSWNVEGPRKPILYFYRNSWTDVYKSIVPEMKYITMQHYVYTL